MIPAESGVRGSGPQGRLFDCDLVGDLVEVLSEGALHRLLVLENDVEGARLPEDAWLLVKADKRAFIEMLTGFEGDELDADDAVGVFPVEDDALEDGLGDRHRDRMDCWAFGEVDQDHARDHEVHRVLVRIRGHAARGVNKK